MSETSRIPVARTSSIGLIGTWIGTAIASLAVVSVTLAAYLLTDHYLEISVHNRLSAAHRMLADHLVDPLKVEDHTRVSAILQSIKEEPDILRAYVVGVNGRRYDSHADDASKDVRRADKIDADVVFGADVAIACYPLAMNKQHLGRLCLESKLTDAESGLRSIQSWQPWRGLLVLCVVLLVGWFMHRLVTRLNSALKAQAESARQAQTSREAAESANQAKNKFLSRLSHELRAPLNVILGFAQVQKSRLPADAPAFMVENTEQTLVAGWQLLKLINDILDVVSVEEHTLSIKMETCKLAEVVSHAASLVSLEADQAGISLECEDSPLLVRADYTRLKQVLVTLFSNAIRYNHPGGSVIFRARKLEEGSIECEIIDTGIGIAESDRDAVFEPFTRLHEAENNDIPGIGIGLTLARYLVDRMGGRIHFISTPGEGSTFYLQLQAAIGNDAPAVDPDPGTSAPDEQTLVIYVEDHRASLELMRAIVDTASHVTLLTATTAEEGIELALQHHPDLMLLDINLPGMNGVTAARQIKKMPELCDVPLVALSADAIESNIEIALNAGFSEYLTKPVNIEQLWKLINDPPQDNQTGKKE